MTAGADGANVSPGTEPQGGSRRDGLTTRSDDHGRELVALGKERFQRGDHSAAASFLEQALAAGVDWPDVHHLLGLAYHNLGEYPLAQRSFERALELNPGYVEAALNLSIVCNDLGQYERAQQVYSAATLRAQAGRKEDRTGDLALEAWGKAKIANLHAAVAEAYASSRRPRDAASEYRRALGLCPQFADLRLKLAHCLADAGEREAALTELKRAVAEAPAFAPARVALGIALYTQGAREEAATHWEHVLRQDPGHRTAATYLKLARSPETAPRAASARGSS